VAYVAADERYLAEVSFVEPGLENPAPVIPARHRRKRDLDEYMK
jgi:hypothetical protein